VADSSDRHDKYTQSAWLFLIALFFAAWTILSLHDKDAHAALITAALALFPASLIPLFIWPTECGFTTRQGMPCRETTFGFLFGCTRYYHFWPKFLVRIHLLREAQRLVGTRQQSGDATVQHQAAPSNSIPVVRVEDTALSLCGTWAGIISATISVIGFAIAIH
jgi:hypothetical protein